MFGNARRIVGTALAIALAFAGLAWPAAQAQGQPKDPQSGLKPATPPPAPTQGQPNAPLTLPPPPPAVMPPADAPQGFVPTVRVRPEPMPAVMPPSLPSGFSLALLPRFTFTIDPKTPLKDLLPASPKVKNAGPLLTDDLSQVPEVTFGVPVEKNAEAMKNTAHMIAKINHLNAKKTEGFLEALRDDRPELRGLSFAMGDACRTKGERNRQFTAAVQTVRSLQQGRNPDQFWAEYQQNHAQCDALIKNDRTLREHDNLARIAALMQIMAPESPGMKLGMVKYLSTLSHAEATRALAKLAIFSPEDEVRHAAIDALKVRRERDYTDVLVQGMRYPWPAVAKRAAEALVKLERSDLIPQLVDLLDEPDPRAPVTTEVEKKKVTVVREVVRLNHHRNCLLCHAPGNTGTVGAETLTVGVPTPDQALNPPSGGYNPGSSPDLLVRIDVTYLRQDFSMFQAVADAAPWPEMQRFDFLVRTRELTDEEAAAFRAKLDKRGKGEITPYHRAAVTALRELTGKDTGPTAQAWRELLDLPERKQN